MDNWVMTGQLDEDDMPRLISVLIEMMMRAGPAAAAGAGASGIVRVQPSSRMKRSPAAVRSSDRPR